MTVDIPSAILSYITIPLYVGGLLILIYLVAQKELGFSLLDPVKETPDNVQDGQRPKSRIEAYLFIGVLFAALTVLSFITQRRSEK